MTWQTLERPGYFGKLRDAKHRQYDGVYGAGNWRIVWQIGQRQGGLDEVVLLYEDAYCAYLGKHPDVVANLVIDAKDIYDDDPSNIASGLDYTKQETGRTHLQDIAIRRCLVRLGEQFRGSRLIRIRDSRGEHPLSLTLSPGRVPFHRTDLIVEPELMGWWQSGSVESFYQSNKLLQVQTADR